MNPTIRTDQEAGMGYLTLTEEKVVRTHSVTDLCNVDFDEHDQIVGIEFPLPGRWNELA